MWITIVVIILAVCMMVGPIMMMQPSKSQKRLAKLRETAVMRGLTVKTCRNPASSEPPYVTVYSKKWANSHSFEHLRDKIDDIIPSLLIQKDYEHELHFNGLWDWAVDPGKNIAYINCFKTCIEQLPETIIGVEVTRESCGIYWLEKQEGLSKEVALSKIQTIIDALYDDILDDLMDQNSMVKEKNL